LGLSEFLPEFRRELCFAWGDSTRTAGVIVKAIRRLSVLLFASFGAVGCGGGSGGGRGGGGGGNPGTTAGAHTVTVTGTDAATGKITSSVAVAVTVN
jgi:hypothetical protein